MTSEDNYTNAGSHQIKFSITENIQKLGIKELTLEKRDFLITWSNGKQNCIDFNINSKSSSLSQNVKLIEKRLRKELKDIVDVKIIDLAVGDIEAQLIKRRDEIYSVKPSENDSVNHAFNSKFLEDVSKIREQFEKSSDPYKEWQQEVKKKYDDLKNITIKHYPEGWQLLQFNLSVKTTLNIHDNKLPFIGIVLYKPSSLKTTFIEFFRPYHRTFFSDTFTPSSIISHNPSLTEEQLQENDMLPKMKDKLVLTPELSSVFTLESDSLTRILGIIVRLADGDGLESDSGAHGHRGYPPTKFAWLGAAVEISPKIWTLLSQLGFKIYFFRPDFKEKSREDLVKIIENPYNNSKNKEIETALLEYLKTFDAAPKTDFSYIDEASGIVKIKWNYLLTDDFKSKKEQRKILGYISDIAKLLSKLRGTVYVSSSKLRKNQKSIKETSSNEEDQDISIQIEQLNFETDTDTIEDPPRAAIQLLNLALANAISQGRNYLIEEDVKLIIDVALSTTRVHRHKILNLLLKNGGELLTSKIVDDLKISLPTARKTMRELDGLGICKVSTTDGYANSELKIKLSNDFNWFLSEEFQRLSEKDKETVTVSTTTNQHSNQYLQQSNTEFKRMYLPLISNLSDSCIVQKEACDAKPCDRGHTLKTNSPPEADKKNIEYSNNNEITTKNSSEINHDNTNQKPLHTDEKEIVSDNFSNNKKSNCFDDNCNNLEKNDIKKQQSEQEESINNTNDNNINSKDNNKRSYQILTNQDKVTDDSSFINSENIQKNNVSLGPKYFQRVTGSQEKNGHTVLVENVVNEIVQIIKIESGPISLGFALQLACQRSDIVKDYLRNEKKLTQKDSKTVRNLFVRINRHPNIKPIKRKPELVVKWIENEEKQEVIIN